MIIKKIRKQNNFTFINMLENLLIWIIALTSIALIIIRPFKLAEFYWTLGGSFLLLLLQLMTPTDAFAGVMKGMDAYLFIGGMMLISEIARREKLFDWLAAIAVSYSNGSGFRLFIGIYLVGVLTTIFLSNDATIVVLTPAVIVAVRAAKIKNPLPFLFICAFVANAASFVLPISNPANIVVYGKDLPPLESWLRQFTLPSIVAVVVTFICLYFNQRRNINLPIERNIAIPPISTDAKISFIGIGFAAVVLLVCSALGYDLGLPTAMSSIALLLIIILKKGTTELKLLRHISWGVLPMIAGLFIIVEGLMKTGLLQFMHHALERGLAQSETQTTWLSGVGIGLLSNVMNNLPAALAVSDVVQAGVPEIIKRAMLIGIDLGPNLSITGSLATILWIVILRKEGIEISAWQFLKIGWIVMLPALLLSIAVLWV